MSGEERFGQEGAKGLDLAKIANKPITVGLSQPFTKSKNGRLSLQSCAARA